MTPGMQQRIACERFHAAAARSLMPFWRLGETFPIKGTHVLLGVATYSLEDLRLLDVLESKLSNQAGRRETIHLFDVSACSEMEDFERYLPGIGKVFQTPVVGLWEDGVLRYKAQGASATAWLQQRFLKSES